jgi:hypothetical protein
MFRVSITNAFRQVAGCVIRQVARLRGRATEGGTENGTTEAIQTARPRNAFFIPRKKNHRVAQEIPLTAKA